MSTSTASIASTTRSGATPVFWEVLWRSAGIQAMGLFVVSAWLFGAQPRLGASASELADFYAGHSLPILIAAAITGLAVLNLMWFAAAIRVTLANAGKDGWGAAATAASAAFGALLLLYTAIGAALTFLTTNPDNFVLASGLNDLSYA